MKRITMLIFSAMLALGIGFGLGRATAPTRPCERMKASQLEVTAKVQPTGTAQPATNPTDETLDSSKSIYAEPQLAAEKTESIYGINDFLLFSEIEKLAATRPQHGPGVGVGLGQPLAECNVSNQDNQAQKYFRVIVYRYGDNIQLIEVIVDGNTERHRNVGGYESKDLWTKLKDEVLRLSEEVKKNKNKKSRLEEIMEEIERRKARIPGGDQEAEQGVDGKPPEAPQPPR